jgi:hypothetical protein
MRVLRKAVNDLNGFTPKGEILRLSNSPKVVAIFLVFLVFYFIIGLFGYGNICDTYGEMRSGQQALLDFKYEPSRPPSYLIPEMAIGLASLIGHHQLSNLISAILGSLTLYLFYQLLRNIFGKNDALLITLAVGLNPFFIIASSSSIDYIYSIFFIFCGIALLDYRKYFLSGLFFSFAISSRLSNVLIIAAIYAFLIITYNVDKDKRQLLSKLIRSSLIALLFTIILYLPVFIVSGYNFSFLTYNIVDWSIFGHLSRCVYKNTYLFGLFASILVFVTSICFIFKKGTEKVRHSLVLFGIGIIILEEILFFKLPYRIYYLLPILFVIVPLWAFLINSKRGLLVLFIFLTFLYNFMNIDVLDRKYDETGSAVSAEIGIFVRPGILIDDLLNRKQSQEDYFNGYNISRGR